VKQAVTLATVAVKFLERTGLAPSTIKTYEITLLSLLAEYGSWSIEIISKQTLVEYLDTLSHLKYTTHHKHQAILQSLFNFAVEQGYIKSNREQCDFVRRLKKSAMPSAGVAIAKNYI
jgi:integrase/recombinase XerD